MSIPPRSSYGSPEDWATIIGGAGAGTQGAMQSAASNAATKYETKEAKRRTLANLLNQNLKRNQGMFRLGQEHTSEMNDQRSQAMKQVAQGFVQALQGSTQ